VDAGAQELDWLGRAGVSSVRWLAPARSASPMPAPAEQPLVTLCVPTIGRLEYLADTRRSIEAQTYKNVEILVLDNCRDPSGSVVLQAWARENPRVRVLRHDAPLGMFQNFNRGIRAAQGAFIAFCHDDDVILPDFLATQAGFLQTHPTVAFSGCNYRYIGHDGRIIGDRKFIQGTELWTGAHYIDLVYSAFGRCPLTLQSVVFRASAIKSLLFDESISPNWGDLVVLMRLAESYDVGVIAETLVHVRNHPTQASKKHRLSDDIKGRHEILSSYTEEYVRRHPANQEQFRRMQYGLLQMYRIGMLRSWLLAGNSEEGRAARLALGDKALDRALKLSLFACEKIGLEPRIRNRIGAVLQRASSRMSRFRPA
jgi:glycosyltransferase involved in cell wall biosynthesis